MSEETTTTTLDHGRTAIPIPGLKKDTWDVERKRMRDCRIITFTEKTTGEKHILTLRGRDGLDLYRCSVSVTPEKDQAVVFVNEGKRVWKEGSGELDFSLESIEPGMESETAEEEPESEPITKDEESPEAETSDAEEPEEEEPEEEPEAGSEETEDLPTPVLLPKPVPAVIPEPSATLTVVEVSVDLHLHNGSTKESLEVYAGPIMSPQPLPTPGPVTSLPNKRRPAPHVEEEPRKPTGLPPAGAPGSLTERHAKLQEEHDRKLAEAALRRRRQANRDARKRERQAAREERRRERPVSSGPSPAILALILVIAVGIAIVVVGIFGAIALFASGDGGHHGATGAENTPPENPDPPVSTPPPENPDPPVSTPTEEPDEQESTEESEPTNTPVEVAPGHIEIILPAGNAWSVAVNTGEEYEIEYSFNSNKSGAEVMIGNGAYGPLDLDWREVNGPFKFRGEEGTKISIKWSPSS